MPYRSPPEALLVDELEPPELRVGALRTAPAEEDLAAGAERVAGGLVTRGWVAGAERVAGLLAAEGRNSGVGVRVVGVDCRVAGAVLVAGLLEVEGRLGWTTVGRDGAVVDGRAAGALLGWAIVGAGGVALPLFGRF